MAVNQIVLDTLVAPTYTCDVSSHSHCRSPRQYLDETVEKKRATGCLSTFLPAPLEGYECLPSLSSSKGPALPVPRPGRCGINVWCYKTEVKGKDANRSCQAGIKGEGRA